MEHIFEAVERRRQLILDTERFVWKHPETGYKEYKTHEYMAKTFEELGYKLTYAEGITGFVTVVDTGREGPEVLILGELDSIICPEHPESDPETGAVHSCGHNAQCAALVGIAAALKDEKVLSKLSGKIRLCAVPAEELLEIGFRAELKKAGKIRYFGGKTEFLYRGLFDGVDIAFMVHTGGLAVGKGHIGCINKQIIYKGKAAHAGGAPWEGNNALYAATCGINAVNAIRETFKDSDVIRVHPIITEGGSMVNAIPSKVKLESYVRGKTYGAIESANKRVNRALVGAALSLGANIEIIDMPGYAPENNDPAMMDIAKEAAAIVYPDRKCSSGGYSSGSTDMGDLSMIMPTVQPNAPGCIGTSHGKDYYIEDPVAACVDSAKWQLVILELLLGNGASRAKQIKAEFKPQFSTKEKYFAYIDSLTCEGDRIEYTDNRATVTL